MFHEIDNRGPLAALECGCLPYREAFSALEWAARGFAIDGKPGDCKPTRIEAGSLGVADLFCLHQIYRHRMDWGAVEAEQSAAAIDTAWGGKVAGSVDADGNVEASAAAPTVPAPEPAALPSHQRNRPDGPSAADWDRVGGDVLGSILGGDAPAPEPVKVVAPPPAPEPVKVPTIPERSKPVPLTAAPPSNGAVPLADALAGMIGPSNG